MKRRVLATFVTIVLCLSCTWSAWADEDTTIEEFVLVEEPVVADEDQVVDEAQADAETQTEIPEGSMAIGETDLSEMIIQAGGFPQAKRNTKSLLLAESSSAKEAIYTGLLNKAESIDLISYNITVNEAQTLYSQVINENPDLFYVNSGLQWSYSGNIIYTLYPSYADYTESQISAFNQRVNQVLASIDPSWTDVEKLMYIHDWIILNCEYDLTYSKYNAYDVIIGGSAVCQGYSLAFSVLARQIEINCSVISSRQLNHAWNLVEAEGRKYYVDCTWDDPSNGITLVCRHLNFLRSKAGIESTEHTAGDWINGATNASAENEAVDSTMYDNCWWISLSQAAALSGGNAYYVDEQDKTVKKYSFDTGTTENVFKCANDSWAVIDMPGYFWNGYFSNVVVRDGKYYYNTSKNIYEVNGGSSSIIYTLSDSQMKHGYIYGLGLDGRNIMYNVADTQYSASYDEMFVLEETAACVEHSYSSSITTEATCTEPGVRTYVCKNCGDTYTETVPAKGHTVVIDESVAATCTTDGKTEGSHCSVCNTVIKAREVVKATGHDWGNWEVTNAATEESEGLETRVCKNDPEHIETRKIPVLTHVHHPIKVESVAATCTTEGNIEYWECDCGRYFSDENADQEIETEETVIAKIPHLYDQGKVSKAPTCTENGEKNYTCQKCEDSYTEIIPATGHDWGDWEVTKEATETTAGEETRTCKNDPSHTETRETAKKQHVHDLVKVPAKAATLNATGNITHYKCSVCGKFFKDKDGKTVTTAKAVTIAKLVNINKATISGISSKAYTGKSLTQNPKVVMNGTPLKKNTEYKLTYKNNTNAGKATVTVSGIGKYGGSVSKTFTINKASNPLTIKTTSKTYKQTALKSARTFTISAMKGQGKVTYTLNAAAKKAKIKVTSKGKVTVPKKCKKGTYKITVKAAGNKNYKAGTKTVTIKIK